MGTNYYFKNKMNELGIITRNKIGFVAKGNN